MHRVRRAHTCVTRALYLCVVFGLVTKAPIVSAAGPVIRHTPLESMPSDQHVAVQASIESDSAIESARLYFRAAQEEDFYYVDMMRDGASSTFTGVLPKPIPGRTSKIVYYVEARDETSESATTPVLESDTTDAPVAAVIYTGNDPAIVVGATRVGMPPVPTGFQPAGIAGFINAAGVTSAAASSAAEVAGTAASGVPASTGTAAASAGGGIGTGVVVAVGGVAAGAATIGVLSGSSNDATPGTDQNSTVNPPPTTGSPPTTPTTPVPPGTSSSELAACFMTSPTPPTIAIGESLELDGRCSVTGGNTVIYQWDLGDGRTRTGPFVTPVFRDSGSFVVTLTLTDGSMTASTFREIEVLPEVPGADLEVRLSNFGPFSQSAGPYFQAVRITNHGPEPASNVTMTFRSDSAQTVIFFVFRSGIFPACVQTPANVSCSVPSMPIGSTVVDIVVSILGVGSAVDSATVSAANDTRLGNNSHSLNVTLIPQQTSDSSGRRPVPSSFASFIDMEPNAGIFGRLTLNQLQPIEPIGATPVRYSVNARAGVNTIDANVVAGNGGSSEGRWRFDFRSSEHFVPGSLNVRSGQVLTLDSTSIVFRLTGASGQRMSFSYQLSP